MVAMMVMTAASFSSRRSKGEEHGHSRESFTHYKVLLLLADHPWCGGSAAMICDFVAKRPQRPDDARQRREHGPLGPLRNALWPKYGGYFCSGEAGWPARFASRATVRDRFVSDPMQVSRSSPAGVAQ
ncbi:hypothetical protein [Bradyrhizobium mercantei]|uniref:hypothetical protein n=1 Tax=Bradyrhizobium mercantei TaxID=1904807 RepID=UPI0011776B03|nr:hypothetical protein [Bradyrhizobium mercantei]